MNRKLPHNAKKAIQDSLDKLNAVLFEDEDGLFRIRENTDMSQTPFETIQTAWANGFIRIDKYGHINILTATKIEMQWDHKSLRRKSEDFLRKSSNIGEIVNLSISLGIHP